MTRVGSRLVGARRIAEEALALAAECQVTFVAAALAYYGFLSFVPLVVLGVTVATAAGGESLADELLAVVGQAVTPTGEALLRSAILGAEGRGGVTAFGLVLLVWGSLRSFRGFDRAFSIVYGTDVRKPLGAAIVDAVVVFVGVGVAALLLAGISVAVVSGTLGDSLGSVALFLSLAILFLPLYYRFPDVPLPVRAAVPGAVFAAAGWTVMGALFQIYAVSFADPSLYGVLGGVLLALTWFYLGALLVLLGAALNAVRWGRRAAETGSADGPGR